jgi:hypothetical protein
MKTLMNRGEMFQKINARMTAYHGDMDLDYQYIIKHPKTKYLLFARDSGTHLIFFHTINELPKFKEYVSFFFSKIDRWQIVTSWETSVNYYNRHNKESHYDIYYFNGEEIHCNLDISEAINIVNFHAKNRRSQFLLEETVIKKGEIL